jgi:hypothetical protein
MCWCTNPQKRGCLCDIVQAGHDERRNKMDEQRSEYAVKFDEEKKNFEQTLRRR